MDRRLLPIVAALAACGGKRPAASAAADAAPVAAAVAAPAPAPAEPDAAVDEPTPPIRPGDLLSGPAAERVIADLPGPAREAPSPDAPELRIYSSGVGPFELGMTRREVAQRLGRRGRFVKMWTPPGEVSLENADMLSGNGLVFMRMKIYGGRLSEILVLGADGRARTDGDVVVGSTFDDATLAHGDARRRGRGFVLSDLPGVIFVPADPSVLSLAAPPPAARVGAILVVGTESD